MAAHLALLLAMASACDGEDITDAPAFSDLEAAEPEQPEEAGDSAAHTFAAAPSRHCVVETHAVPVGEDDRDAAETAPSAGPVCFSRFSDAIAFATGEVLSADASPADYRPQSLSTGGHTAATYVIGVEFTGANYTGSTYTVTSDKTCVGYTHSKSTIPLDNMISSAKAYSGCNHAYHYDNAYFGGAVFDSLKGSGSLGALDNLTSSIRWKQ